MDSSKGCHDKDVTESAWPTRACNLDFRFRRSHRPIELSAEPVARTYSEAGLNEIAFIASEWPSTAFALDAVVLGFRTSIIWSVRSSETLPISEGCKGWCCTSFTIAVWCVYIRVAWRALLFEVNLVVSL